MDNWEITDEVLVQFVERMEAENEFVPETQFETVTEAQFEIVLPANGVVVQSALDNQICLGETNQRPGKQINGEGRVRQDRHPLCHCGDVCEVVVCKTQTNAGRRFYGCAGYLDHITNPKGVECCNFFKWLDRPLTPRGVEYALEMQAEVRRLEKEKSQLRHQVEYLQSINPIWKGV